MESKIKRQATRLILLCAFAYFVSYLTRNNYSAVISEMVTSTGLPKSALSLALTGSFITYGFGQVITGVLGDKIQPRRLIAAGLATTSCMNLLIPLCADHVQMAAVWCLNGFAQAFMWPPIVKIMYSELTTEEYDRGCVVVSRGSFMGNVIIYLTAPVLILLVGWRSIFVTSACAGMIGLILWLKLCPNITMTPTQKPSQTQIGGKTHGFLLPLILVMLAIMMNGILRDSVSTWMPSYISETYGLSNALSIFSGTLLPIFSILSHSVTHALYRSRLQNPFTCSAVIYGFSTLIALLMFLFYDKNAILSIALCTLLTGGMHGVNLMLIGIIPPHFSRTGNVSTISGLLNACVYAGSAVSAWLVPFTTEWAGWDVSLLMWVGFSFLGMALCGFCIPSWKNLKR